MDKAGVDRDGKDIDHIVPFQKAEPTTSQTCDWLSQKQTGPSNETQIAPSRKMQIVDGKYLIVRTKYPEKITNAVKEAKVLRRGDVSDVEVPWTLDNAQLLRNVRIKTFLHPLTPITTGPVFTSRCYTRRLRLSFLR